jgi:hypothetical protein
MMEPRSCCPSFTGIGSFFVWDQTVHPCGIAKKVIWNPLRIDHFVVKSRVEFERKRARGDVMSRSVEDQRNRDNYFRTLDRNEVSDPVPEPLVRQTKFEIERLLETLG